MLINTKSNWDKNRPIFFQIGLITALSITNIVINVETAIPKYDVFESEEWNKNDIFHQVISHAEAKPVYKSLVQNLDPLHSKIVLTPDPIVIDESSQPTIDNASISDIPSEALQPMIFHPILPKEKPKENKIHTIVENMPYIADCKEQISEEERRLCTQQKILTYLYKYLKYPAIARESAIEGTVIISFIIDNQGKMKNTEIVRDIGGGCGQEALKAIRGLDKWVSGKQNNHPVNVKYTIPVKFKLQ